MLVVNLFGEPGCGKSVTAAGLFYELAIKGIQVEIIHEVAKGYAWETPKDLNGLYLPHPIFQQQVYLLGEQNRLLERVLGKRQVAIMECPLIMTSVYRPDNYLPSFDRLALEQFNMYNNFNILLKRSHSFDKEGRVHNEQESETVREKLINYLNNNNIDYTSFTTHKEISLELSDIIIKHFQDSLKI